MLRSFLRGIGGRSPGRDELDGLAFAGFLAVCAVAAAAPFASALPAAGAFASAAAAGAGEGESLGGGSEGPAAAGSVWASRGGLFDYASSAQYFCELWAWAGFALLSAGPNGAFIFCVSLGNLVPRAMRTHTW